MANNGQEPLDILQKAPNSFVINKGIGTLSHYLYHFDIVCEEMDFSMQQV